VIAQRKPWYGLSVGRHARSERENCSTEDRTPCIEEERNI
jgi:hypothetical protein